MSKSKVSPSDVACSFCNKRAAQVESLISGPGVHICDECVQIATEIISNHYKQNKVAAIMRLAILSSMGVPRKIILSFNKRE